MSFEISGMPNTNSQSWAKKCDANGDGKIDGNELSIFNQGKENMHDSIYGIRTTVGGVTFRLDEIQTIQRNQDGDKFDYSVRFDNGTRLQFDEQEEGNEAEVFSFKKPLDNGYIFSSISNITDGDGFSIKGTRGKDDIFVKNSTIDRIDGLWNKDKAFIFDSVGNKGSGEIFAETSCTDNSSGLTTKKSSQKILRPKAPTNTVFTHVPGK